MTTNRVDPEWDAGRRAHPSGDPSTVASASASLLTRRRPQMPDSTLVDEFGEFLRVDTGMCGRRSNDRDGLAAILAGAHECKRVLSYQHIKEFVRRYQSTQEPRVRTGVRACRGLSRGESLLVISEVRTGVLPLPLQGKPVSPSVACEWETLQIGADVYSNLSVLSRGGLVRNVRRCHRLVSVTSGAAPSPAHGVPRGRLVTRTAWIRSVAPPERRRQSSFSHSHGFR